ncbi:hypothetical protein JRO89_XS06G0091000 [Xanthoceras sorbifolium]|uniref:G-type lectin S-receptor-like serine/threonine-protein kinase n=1 Tax=Xanthoceras sorbifolium TaxID=99658 RepID=A0ABQ8HXF2_9ROSI|nr:hypothetical protein JRO89_XS06G0091000 [Xanthoceras sorbifolium]
MELSGGGGLPIALILLLLFYFCSDFGAAIDTITASQPIRDHETIVSSDNAFKLGFFSPVNSTNRYLGIWYNDKSEAVIWVANRDKPVEDASGVVTISEDGNLVVLNGQKEVLWSSKVSNSFTNVSAQLLDSGNLVLNNITTGGSIWDSFQQPTDTLMRRMRLSTDKRTGENVQLTSWTSPSDPSTGSFSAGISLLNIPQVFIWNNNLPFWRSGQWNGREFMGITNVNSVYLGGFELVEDNEEGSAYVSFDFSIDPSTYFILSSQGRIIQRDRVSGKDEWAVSYTYPQNDCDIYGMCGSFGSCDARGKPICSCLRGFEPKNREEWNRGNWTGGCVRRTPLQCESVNKTGEADKEDGFLKFGMIKIPDFAERTSAPEDKCRELCLSNCSCIAYSYDVGIGCMSWRDNLTDVQQFYSKGTDFYLRVANSELAADKKDMKVVIIVPVVVGTVAIAICAFFLWRWMAKRKGNSTNRYVGIWYNDKSEAVIWVANRNKPLNDSSGVVTISEEGKLVVLNGQNEVLWSSNVSNSATNASAQLLDSGNLVLQDNINGDIWESFQEPTDAFMRWMKLSTNAKTGEKVLQTSWKSPSDPSTGSFSAGLDLLNIPQIFIWNNNIPYWRAGQWNGREFIGITNVDTVYLGGFQLVEDSQEGTASISFEFPLDPSTYFLLTSHGRTEQRDRVDGKDEWVVRHAYPENDCDLYGWCGAYGICDATKKPICSCLRGFQPKNVQEWNRGNWTGGCVRRKTLQCEGVNRTSEANEEDGFLKMEKIKVPDFAERTYDSEDKCRELCLSNCSCIAYAYAVGIGCMKWRDNLIDTQQFYGKGTEFYIRLAHSELDKDKKDMKVVITVSVVVGVVTMTICTLFLWRWMVKRQAMKDKSKTLQVDEGDRNSSNFGTAIDTITTSRPIRDHETITSNSSAFKFGFFSPGNSLNRYVGIWYNDKSKTVIWVANRNKPLNCTSGVVTISEDGNLVVLNGQNQVVWSSNVPNSVTVNAGPRLLDTGNLVLLRTNSNGSIWESFQEPTDTFMSKMKLGTDERTGEKLQLTSWKDPFDPSIGCFSAGIGPSNMPEVFIWTNNSPYWRSGPWNGRAFIGVQDGFDIMVDNQEGTAYL